MRPTPVPNSPLDIERLRSMVEATGAVFVVDAREAERADSRRYAKPLLNVGPVRSGQLREFEEPKS